MAYHLSVLKDKFPNGINLLSLFSGIVVQRLPSIDLVSVWRMLYWWRYQKWTEILFGAGGSKLIKQENWLKYKMCKNSNLSRLKQLMEKFGVFDLVVGGSPCNNLSGGNRVSRDGLEGKESSLFYEFWRILYLVKCIMAWNGWFDVKELINVYPIAEHSIRMLAVTFKLVLM